MDQGLGAGICRFWGAASITGTCRPATPRAPGIKKPIACVTPGHPLLGATPVTWPDLLRYPMIRRDDGPGAREAPAAALAARGLATPFGLEAGSANAVIVAVMAGNDIGLVTQGPIAPRPDWRVWTLALQGHTTLQRTLYVATPEAP